MQYGRARGREKLREHLSVAHFVAGPRSQELRCSRAHCVCRVVLRFSISVPCAARLLMPVLGESRCFDLDCA